VRRLGGQPAAVVRWQELQREFMRAWLPGWHSGLGRRAWFITRACAVLVLIVMLAKASVARREARTRHASARFGLSAADSISGRPAPK
jgi:hypothetical protein